MPLTDACPDQIRKWADPAFVKRVEARDWQLYLDALCGAPAAYPSGWDRVPGPGLDAMHALRRGE